MTIYYRERVPGSPKQDSEKDMYLLTFLDCGDFREDDPDPTVIREYLVFRFALDTFFEEIFDHREILQSVKRVDWDRVEDLKNDMTKIEDPEKFSRERGLGPMERNHKHIEKIHDMTHNDKGERVVSLEEMNSMDFSLDEDEKYP